MTAPSGLPTGPFPLLDVEPSRYDDSRRRAKARRWRRTAVAGAAVLAVLGGGLVAVTRPGGTTRQPAVGVEDGTIADFMPRLRHNPVTEQQLTAMATDCPGRCGVIDRVDYTEGRTAALIGRFDSTGSYEGTPWSFVLAKGEAKVDEVRDEADVQVTGGSFSGFHGVTLLSTKQSSGSTQVSLVVRGTHLDLTNGGFSDPQIVSDYVWPVQPVDPVTFEFLLLTGRQQDGRWSYTRWGWTGSRWEGDSCQPDFERVADPDGRPGCTARSYPDQPAWVDQIGCGHENCWVDGPVTFPNGDRLAALYADGPSKLVLMRAGAVIDTLPETGFSGGLPKDLVVDKTGHALLRLTDHEEKKSWVLPLGDVDGKLTVLQGGYASHHALEGAQGAQVQDVDGDGTMEVLTTDDGSVSTYHWLGNHYATTDAAVSSWTSQVEGCQTLCVETGKVPLAGGVTFSVLKGQVEGRFKVVLRRGEQVLDALPDKGFADGYASDPPETDASGRVLLHVGGGATASWALPFGTSGGRLSLMQGSFDTPDLRGDNNIEFKDTDGDGILEVLVGQHAPYKSSTTTYSWNGSSYVKTHCTGELC